MGGVRSVSALVPATRDTRSDGRAGATTAIVRRGHQLRYSDEERGRRSSLPQRDIHLGIEPVVRAHLSRRLGAARTARVLREGQKHVVLQLATKGAVLIALSVPSMVFTAALSRSTSSWRSLSSSACRPASGATVRAYVVAA